MVGGGGKSSLEIVIWAPVSEILQWYTRFRAHISDQNRQKRCLPPPTSLMRYRLGYRVHKLLTMVVATLLSENNILWFQVCVCQRFIVCIVWVIRLSGWWLWIWSTDTWHMVLLNTFILNWSAAGEFFCLILSQTDWSVLWATLTRSNLIQTTAVVLSSLYRHWG